MATKKKSRKPVAPKQTAAKQPVAKQAGAKKATAKKAASKKKPAPRKPAAKPLASNVIHVPRAAPGSYDPSRPLSKNTLLMNQVRHFQQIALEKGIPAPDAPAAPRTEGEAAEYLRKMTAILHPEGQPTSAKLPPGIQLKAKRGRNA